MRSEANIPKRVILRDNPINIDQVAISVPAKKKRGFCKKLKGPHEMEFFETRSYPWYPSDQGMVTRFHEYHCAGCGRKDIKIVNEKI